MGLTDEEIALRGRDYLPETWRQLGNPKAGGDFYGPQFLERHVKSVMRRYIGAVIDGAAQEDLPELVLEYLGMKLAHRLTLPGIDFWSKQAVQIGSAGTNEQKTYADRAEKLKDLRGYLEQQMAEIWLDVEPLLPDLATQTRAVAVPLVRETDTTAFTPDPNSIEPVFDRSREEFGPRSA